MITNWFNKWSNLFRPIIFIGIICVLSIFAGYFFESHGLGDKLLGNKVITAIYNHANWSNILVLVIRRVFLFVVIGASALLGAWAIFRKNYEYLLYGFILSFAFASALNSIFFSFNYVDSIGISNPIGLINCLLVGSFLILVVHEYNWIHKVFYKPTPWCFVALGFFGLLTQVYHLGVGNSLIILFIRIVQPLIFIILVSHSAQSKQGLRNIMIVLITSIALTIFFRIISPAPEVTNPALNRVSELGSWTIYGTLLVASIPMAMVLWVTTPKLRLFIAGIVPLTIYEAYLTQTRGAIAALGLLGLFVLEKRFRLLIILLLFLAFILLLSRPDLFVIHLTGNRILSIDPRFITSDPNWAVRVQRNLSALRFIESHPFTGLGLGQPTLETGDQLAFWVYNPYLHWGVAMGIPAMLAFAFMMFHSITNAIRNFTSETRDLKIYQLGILIALSIWVLNQFTTGDSLTYLSSPEATLMFYFVIGLILGQQLERESKFQLVEQEKNY